jgi:hypothetical protein
VVHIGYLTEKYFKDKSKKYYIYIALDIILIFVFIFFALSMKSEFDSGAKFILYNVPAYCLNNTLYQKTLDYYNVTPDYAGILPTDLKVKVQNDNFKEDNGIHP